MLGFLLLSFSKMVTTSDRWEVEIMFANVFGSLDHRLIAGKAQVLEGCKLARASVSFTNIRTFYY